MAWAAHEPLKWRLTVGFHGPVNRPNAYLWYRYCLLTFLKHLRGS